MSISEDAKKMKAAAPYVAGLSHEVRINALRAVKKALNDHRDEIFRANAADIERAENDGVNDAIKKRLKFDEAKLSSVSEGIDQLVELPDPVGKVSIRRELDEGLVLTRRSCPIGVIGVIFEARPDALVQIGTLCLKSGNCALLKGGRETAETNRVLFNTIKDAAVGAGVPEGALMQAETHADVDELLTCDGEVDLLIPRGSNAFVRYIMDHTRIPVMGHADGICSVYVDKDADFEKAKSIVLDAKTQYTAVCNAAETLLIHRDVADKLLPAIADELKKSSVIIHGDEDVAGAIEAESLGEEGYAREYLGLEISARVVDSIEDAIDHINTFGSHHTDAIITENREAADHFADMVDSANVFINASTRFSDGFRYGFGAEVGISTSKLHARGPVGLEGLMTYKYILEGSGNIVAPYADGSRQFHFRDLSV